MGDVVGRAFIEVSPDVSKFARKLTRDLNKAFRNFKKVSVGISVGSIRKAFVEVSKLNTALRATVLGFSLLAGKAVVAGLISVASAATELSGALGVVPALAASAAIGMVALKVGVLGLDDVMKALVKGDMKKFTEALAEMSPEAQKTLGVIKEFIPQIEKFKDAVQDALFKDLGGPLRDLIEVFLPRIQKGFVGITGTINQAAKQLAAFLLRADTRVDIDTIFANTTKTFKQLVPAGLAVVQIFRDIATVGSQFLPGIAAAISIAANRLRNFVSEARATGVLQQFIARGLAELQQLIRVVVNVAKGLAGVFHAARDSGADILDIAERISLAFKRFATSIEGQASLRSFFDNARVAAASLGPPLKAVFQLLAEGIGPILARFASIVSPALTRFINDLTAAVKNAGPGLERFGLGFAQFIDAIRPALGPIGVLTNVLGNLLGQALQKLGPLLEKFVSLVVDGLFQALSNPQLISGLFSLVDAFGQFFIALVPVLGPLTELALQLLPLLVTAFTALTPVLGPLIRLFANVVSVITPLINIIQTLLVPIAGLLTGFATLATVLTSSTTTVIAVLGALVVAAGVAGVALNLLGVNAALTGGFIVKFGRTIATTAGFLLGPWGLALTAAIGILTVFGIKANQASERNTQIKTSADAVTAALKEQNGVVNGNVRAVVAKELADLGAFTAGEKLGLSAKTVTDAMLGETEAIDEVKRATADLIKNDPLSEQGQAAVKLTGTLTQLSNAMSENEIKTKQIAAATGESTAAAKAARDAYAQYAASLDKVFDGLVKTGQVQLSARESERALAEAYTQGSETIKKNGETLDINTKKGQENSAALDNIAAAALRNVEAQRNAGASTEQLNASMTTARQKFLEAASAAGLGAVEANKLADKLGLIPGNYEAKIVVNADRAIDSLTSARNLLAQLQDKTITLTTNVRQNILREARFGMAEGGLFRAGDVAVVGEEGPEIVRFGSSGRVFSNDESAAMVRRTNELTTSKASTLGEARTTEDGSSAGPVEVVIPIQVGSEVIRVVRVEIDRNNRAIARTISSGVGGAR